MRSNSGINPARTSLAFPPPSPPKAALSADSERLRTRYRKRPGTGLPFQSVSSPNSVLQRYNTTRRKEVRRASTVFGSTSVGVSRMLVFWVHSSKTMMPNLSSGRRTASQRKARVRGEDQKVRTPNPNLLLCYSFCCRCAEA